MHTTPNERAEAPLGHMLADFYLAVIWITLFAAWGWKTATESIYPLPARWGARETFHTMCLLGAALLVGYTAVGSVPLFVPVLVFFIGGAILMALEAGDAEL